MFSPMGSYGIGVRSAFYGYDGYTQRHRIVYLVFVE